MVKYTLPNDYRTYFEHKYCKTAVLTFDGVAVRFRKAGFNHCFYESSKRNKAKDIFSRKRAERIDWIQAALQDPQAELYVGWDRKRKRYDNTRRVALVNGDYVIVIRITGPKTAEFITAYVVDTAPSPGRPSTVEMIRKSPKWS